MNFEKVGIVFSGGAVRGAAHIGVLKALEEYDIKPKFISGVSAGSIVSVFYGDGYSPKEMEEILLKTDYFSYIKPRFPKVSFFSLEKMDKLFDKYISKKNLQDLDKKVFICITDLLTGNTEYINSGNISLYVRASCSLPMFFEPTVINGVPYIDGGITNNLPVEPLRNISSFIIGSEVNPLGRIKKIPNIFSLGLRSLYLAIRSNTERNKAYCDIFIQPPQLVKIGLFSTKQIKEAIDIGYLYTKRILKSIEKDL